MFKVLVTALAAIPVLLLGFGGMTALHPLADSLAVFRLPLGGLTMLSGIVIWRLWSGKAGLMVLALGAAAAGAILMSMMPLQQGAVQYSHYQKNLSYRLRDSGPLIADIQKYAPDFVTLQEVTARNNIVLQGLAESHPTRHYCKFARVGGVAVAAHWPLVEGSKICVEQDGLAAMQVTTPDGPVWLVSIHLHWPYPYGQAAQVQRLLPVLAGLKGPVFLGGDFNMVPWSKTMTVIEQATSSRRIGQTNGTFRLKQVFNMPIDHVLAPPQFTGTVESLGLLGSDHQGVLARMAVQP